jgi:hypothetical protein
LVLQHHFDIGDFNNLVHNGYMVYRAGQFAEKIHGREDPIMKTVELRAAAKKLRKSHRRFAPLFGRVENQQHSLGYVRTILTTRP